MHTGIIAGVDYSSASESGIGGDGYEYKFGYYGGVTFNYALNKIFGMGCDLIYVLKGYNLDIDGNQSANLHYIEMPLLANITFLSNQNVESNIFLGPYFAYLLDASSEYDYNENYFAYSDYEDFDFGIAGGVAFLFPLKSNKLGIELRYDWGIINSINTTSYNFGIFGGTYSSNSLKNSSFMLGVKFLFNIKTKSSSDLEGEEDDTIWQ